MRCVLGKWVWAFTLVGLFTAPMASSAQAAEREFVGILALAVEDAVARKLELTDEQLKKLNDLIDQRETKALSLAVELKDASPAEREEKLAPFRQESEAAGLPILTDEQRALLEQVRLQRAGTVALGEPGVMEKLELSEEQKDEIQKLLANREAELARTRESSRPSLVAEYDRRLMAVLDEEQREQWSQLTGQPIAKPQTAQTQPAQPDQPAQPAAGGEDNARPQPAASTADARLRFNFRFAAWGDVLDWFAQQAGLSLVMDAPPTGTFNYTDSRSYTPAEAIDLLNSVLLTKGYTLVKRDRMLMLINLEDGIPPNLVPDVPLSQLDTKGEFELISVLFQVSRMTPEEAEAEIRRVLGPQGAVVTFPKAGLLRVTETAGRLRMIRSVLEAIENPGGAGTALKVFDVKHQETSDVLGVVRQLLDIPPDAYVSTDGSVRMALDPTSGRLLVTGKPDALAKVDEILKIVDVPLTATESGAPAVIEQPQLEVYSVTGADPTSVLQVLQTLLATFPDVRLATDPKTGNLIAYARPEQHKTIRATIDQMQRDSRRVEVIRLSRLDPALAVAAIKELFPAEGATGTAPTVNADPLSRQLLVRATESQLTQIRSLLEKMGEAGVMGGDGANVAAADSGGGTVRMLPLHSRSVQAAMEQVQQLWSTMRPNKIRIVQPSATISSKRAVPPAPAERPMPDAGAPQPEPAPAPSTEPPQPQEAPTPVIPPARDARQDTFPEFRVVRPASLSMAQAQQQPSGRRQQPAGGAESQPSDEAADKELPPIIVAPGPGGTMIASDDVEALDEFEALLNALTSRQFAGGSQYTVFYLANASAQTVAETLDSIFLGGSAASSSGGSLIGDLAGSVIGGTAGSLVSGLLGGGGSTGPAISSTGVQIIPEPRLNALIVRAGPADLDLIETLLEVLDTAELPETQVSPKPRLIPVRNTSADQIAEIVREVYSDRIVGSRGSQRQPSPEEFIQLLRGGGNSRGGSSSRRGGPADGVKMSVSVDPRTNSLIVAAPQALFEEVELLVQTLDHATSESNTAMKVVTLRHSNATTVQKAISAIAGEQVRTSRPSEGSSDRSSSRGGGDSQDYDSLRRRMEFFNSLRGGSSGGSPFGGSRDGGSDRSRFFGGFGGSRDGGRGSSRGRD